MIRRLSTAKENLGSGSFWILAGAIWSAPPTAALWLSGEPVATADVSFQLSVAKRAKEAALPPHSKPPTVSGPSYRTPQNDPLPKSVAVAPLIGPDPWDPELMDNTRIFIVDTKTQRIWWQILQPPTGSCE